jgi:hypothetical protein
MSFVTTKLNYTVSRVIKVTDAQLAASINVTVPTPGTVIFEPVLDGAGNWYIVIAVPGAT